MAGPHIGTNTVEAGFLKLPGSGWVEVTPDDAPTGVKRYERVVQWIPVGDIESLKAMSWHGEFERPPKPKPCKKKRRRLRNQYLNRHKG